MKRKKNFIIFSIIVSSLLAGSAFAGRTGHITKQTPKPVGPKQSINVANETLNTDHYPMNDR